MRTAVIAAVDLKDKVLEELKWEPSVNEAEIGVIVKDGIVTLTGSVPSWAQKVAAERATQRVMGVKGVANELEVRIFRGMERSDSDIAAAAANAISWNTLLPQGQIKVAVERGWVSLRGQVDWEYQRRAAEKAVRHLTGVKAVVNDLTIVPSISAGDVKAKITVALERNAHVEADKIQVEVKGSRVILRGTVQSLAEKYEAARACWSAPGVTAVENDIQVK